MTIINVVKPSAELATSGTPSELDISWPSCLRSFSKIQENGVSEKNSADGFCPDMQSGSWYKLSVYKKLHFSTKYCRKRRVASPWGRGRGGRRSSISQEKIKAYAHHNLHKIVKRPGVMNVITSCLPQNWVIEPKSRKPSFTPQELLSPWAPLQRLETHNSTQP